MAISQNFPNTRPSLNLNFARSKTLDPRITFSRTNPTATYVDDNGLIVAAGADEPRFDHDPTTGESLGLLVEEQRVNELEYGETFNTAWSHIGFTSNAVDSTYINPTGGTGAKKLIEETGNSSGQKVLYRDITVSSNNAVYTHSCFVKPIGDRNIQLTIHNAGSPASSFSANFNLAAETADSTGSGGGASLDDYGVIPYPNGWYRVYVTGNTSSNNSTGTLLRFHIRICNDSYTTNYTGDGSSGLYVYGGQMELGAFPTSLIKNSTNSDVTRSPDNVSMTGTNFSDWYNTTEGTIFVDCTPVYSSPTNQYKRLLSIHNNSGSQVDVIQLIQYEQSNVVQFAVWDGSSPQALFSKSSFTSGTRFKVAFAVKENNINASYDGNIGTDDTTCTLPAMTQMDIGKYTTGSGTQTTVHINNISYYPTRLSNTVLQTLTK